MSLSQYDVLARKRFRRALRNAMDSCGLTCYELAAALNCSLRMVEQASKCGITPGSPWFIPMCRELNLDPLSFGFIHYGPILEKRLKDGDLHDRKCPIRRKRKNDV